MTAEIIAIGTELLLGQIANTDAQYLSAKLAQAGVDVFRHLTVGDNLPRAVGAITSALARCDLVVVTGGLGPTADDITRQAVAEAAGRPLCLDQASLEGIQAYFAATGREMTPNNRRQAYFPQGAQVLPNACGTAPGCWLEVDDKHILVLPGPPHELIDMYEKQAAARVDGLTGQTIVSRVLRVFGMGESKIEHLLADILAAQTNPTIAPLIGNGDVTLRLTAKADTREACLAAIQPVEQAIRQRLGDAIYAVSDQDMCGVAAALLMQSGKTLAVAESLTGGMLADKFIEHPGISQNFLCGVVAYSNQAKTALLGVPEELIRQHGAVSAEVACAMARGAQLAGGADYGLSTTGIAGPDGGSDAKPVGTVYVGVALPDGRVHARKLLLGRTRQRIRQLSCVHACNLLRLALEGRL